MTISTLTLGGSLGLAAAVVVCAAVLFVNVRREISGMKRRAPRTAEPPAAPAQEPAGGLTTEQVVAAAAYYYLHPEE